MPFVTFCADYDYRLLFCLFLLRLHSYCLLFNLFDISDRAINIFQLLAKNLFKTNSKVQAVTARMELK